jgi:hypothetical protein
MRENRRFSIASSNDSRASTPNPRSSNGFFSVCNVHIGRPFLDDHDASGDHDTAKRSIAELYPWSLHSNGSILNQYSPVIRPHSALEKRNRWIPPVCSDGIWLEHKTEPTVFGKLACVPAPTQAFQDASSDLEVLRMEQERTQKEAASRKLFSPSQKFLVPTQVTLIIFCRASAFQHTSMHFHEIWFHLACMPCLVYINRPQHTTTKRDLLMPASQIAAKHK